MMSKAKFFIVAAILCSSMTGCGAFRSMEQWKCDRLGMCYFGTRPSVPVAQPLPVYQMAPAPCCSNAPAPIYQPQ